MADNRSQGRFLVQVTEPGSKNILNNARYRNDEWKSLKKDRDHGDVRPNDLLVVYYGGSAIDFQKHIGNVQRVVSVSGGGLEFSLEKFRDLRPIPLGEIRSAVRSGELSQAFLNCGRQGFNICKIPVSDYEKVIGISDRLPPQPPTIGAEDLLEDFIVNNWKPGEWLGKQFESLEILRDENREVVGQQYDTREVGIIDLLCRDKKSKAYVVIELKRGNETSDEVAGQLARYVAWIKTNLARGEKVTGIVVCGGHDKKLEYAIETLKDCFIAHYDVKFTITLAKSMIGS